MPEQKRHAKQDDCEPANLPLFFFACPNSDCADFSHFDADSSIPVSNRLRICRPVL